MAKIEVRWLTYQEVQAELASLERRHPMTLAEFYQAFSGGKLPEHPDFIRRAGLWEMMAKTKLQTKSMQDHPWVSLERRLNIRTAPDYS